MIELGKDAKRPFLIEPPLDVYKRSNMEKDVIFYHTNAVRMKLASRTNLSNILEFWSHFIGLSFFGDIFMKYFDVWDLDENFHIELPFDENNSYYNFKSFGTEVRNSLVWYN